MSDSGEKPKGKKHAPPVIPTVTGPQRSLHFSIPDDADYVRDLTPEEFEQIRLLLNKSIE